MTKLVRNLAAQSQQQQQQEGQLMLGPDGQPLPNQYQQPRVPINPDDLQFCRVLYDYPPPDKPSVKNAMDLAVRTGDPVALLSKNDPSGSPSEWWQCRTRDHRIGYLPSVYLEPIVKKPVEQIEGHSRVNTLSSVIGGKAGSENSSRASSLRSDGKGKEKEKVGVVGKRR